MLFMLSWESYKRTTSYWKRLINFSVVTPTSTFGRPIPTRCFLNVANAYPQLAFEHFVSHFPSLQCPDDCHCFVCENLIRRDLE